MVVLLYFQLLLSCPPCQGGHMSVEQKAFRKRDEVCLRQNGINKTGVCCHFVCMNKWGYSLLCGRNCLTLYAVAYKIGCVSAMITYDCRLSIHYAPECLDSVQAQDSTFRCIMYNKTDVLPLSLHSTFAIFALRREGRIARR